MPRYIEWGELYRGIYHIYTQYTVAQPRFIIHVVLGMLYRADIRGLCHGIHRGEWQAPVCVFSRALLPVCTGLGHVVHIAQLPTNCWSQSAFRSQKPKPQLAAKIVLALPKYIIRSPKQHPETLADGPRNPRICPKNAPNNPP